ncbi:2-C-methyl-D-erythritol 4-phosphate cytidylyltransferase [Heliophilum fasciatum]|uniref:Bifunctional enzyme IspD/IspF n=1 Tax=Heliophilum fasciatum TaxID=35700 RepID=A0A4R2RQH7_9FIRM|nr:2-C-methyl-D-erythritol 4-phosphate cytidylyltransferase [Heliophilum fasciatum]MCW2277840.1 2-C-methyl-D-erythritol 4-phosphate cytidylyltransferase/2-C-methyl-D-erythritol 2,4-cyclodiphosphate synthase [Heliophilum fasciatum]TCP64667.1 2-C-methyl-D-erythritol 2,4-cyclodiphosphate synthase [Heliophilum fasciatum]
MSNPSCAALIVAAGRGKRMGAPKNKVLLPLQGKPVIWWTLQGFLTHPAAFAPIVLVVAEDELAYMEGLIAGFGWADQVRLVAGGAERSDSVRAGLALLAMDSCEWVAVHDGARPLFSSAMLTRCLESARQRGSAVAAVPVKDTIKKAAPSGEVIDTPTRDQLFGIQTPQIFRYGELVRAYDRLGQAPVTDDAMVMERAGHPVYLAEGEYENVKLTTPEDLVIAEAILAKRTGESHGVVMSRLAPPTREAGTAPDDPVRMPRVGLGYDVHRLVEARPLILGGVTIPYHLGLLGHSDADVLLHAIKDAILGAAGMGDIGRHFPDSDPTYKGASSMMLLSVVVDKLRQANMRVQQVDATIVAQRPKLAPYIPEMVAGIAATIGVEPSRINVKATTTEGLGFTGTGEGIAAYAVATVRSM